MILVTILRLVTIGDTTRFAQSARRVDERGKWLSGIEVYKATPEEVRAGIRAYCALYEGEEVREVIE